MEKFEDNLTFEDIVNQTLKQIKVGTTVNGTIVEINSKGEIFANIGYKADGIIPRNEFFSEKGLEPAEEYKVGDKIKADILKMNDGQGNVLMSCKHAKIKEIRKEFNEKVEENFIFEEPVSLFPYTKIALKSLKHALTKILWNPNTTEEKNIQFQGINQGFRVVGSKNYKTPEAPYTLQAFRFNNHPFSLKELNSYVMPEDRVDESRLFEERNYTWQEAKAKFPQWANQFETEEEYQTRGGHGLHLRKTEAKKWHLKRSVYEWWKQKMWSSTVYGRRYFNVMMLVIYAVKCQYDAEMNPSGVTREELEADIKAIQPKLTAINPEFPFTDSDIDAALECYDLRYATFPLDSIEKLSGAIIQRNKRNGRSQADHLKLARFVRDEINGSKDWNKKGGRPSKASIVHEFRVLHPDLKQSDCVRATGLSKATVSRHWASSIHKKVCKENT